MRSIYAPSAFKRTAFLAERFTEVIERAETGDPLSRVANTTTTTS